MQSTDLIRSTTDPEHPLSLEQLAVVSLEQCKVTHGPRPSVFVEFTVGNTLYSIESMRVRLDDTDYNAPCRCL